MNIYLKIFFIAILCFVLLFGSGMYAFNKYYVDNSEDLTEAKVIGIDMSGNNSENEDNIKNEEVEVIIEKTKLEKLIEKSNRVNVLVFGTDGGRADTIFLVSYDPDNNLADLISVPRDTYHKVDGFSLAGQNKINAVYGFRDLGGSKGMKYFLSEFLNVPIDHYVKVNYNGAAAIIDVIGGIKINVPFDMNYDDEWAKPELHIHLDKGEQTLNGKQSVEYLRWRKNNGEEGRGDLARIDRQQEFVKRVIDKAIGLKLPQVVKTSLNYIRTDMSAGDIINLATQAADFKMNDLKTYRIPGRVGTDGHGLYIHNPEEMEKMFEDIYLRETIKE